jgi:hypothetical protein
MIRAKRQKLVVMGNGMAGAYGVWVLSLLQRPGQTSPASAPPLAAQTEFRG